MLNWLDHAEVVGARMAGGNLVQMQIEFDAIVKSDALIVRRVK